jgi:polysaccharide biosynthesis protein PslH
MPPRLVAISTLPLWPPTDGISLRAVKLLEHLAGEWSIRLVAPGRAAGESSGPKDLVTLPSPRLVHWSPAPSQAAISPIERIVRDALGREPADVLLLWVGAEPICFRGHGLPPAVGDRIDAVTLAAARDLRHVRSVRAVVSSLRTLSAYAAYERRVVRSQAGTIVVGQDDARMLRRLSGRSSVYVVPNGVSAGPEPSEGTEDSRPTVIFSGVLGYPPNVEAVLWFAREVWPLVREAEPTARFVVAGRRPVDAIRAQDARNGIEVLADVPDMRAELTRAWIAVAPMRSGTGIKNKVLEAWAAAKPAVLTTLASNGLTMDADARGQVVDDAAAMAGRILALFRDPAERRRLGRAGRALALRAHSWAEAGASVSRLLDQAAGRGPPGRPQSPLPEATAQR